MRARGIVFAGSLLVALPLTARAQEGTWEGRAGLSVPRRLLAAVAEGGRIYAFGGCGSPCFQPPFHVSTFEETRVEVYDPGTDSWSVREPMPAVFFGGAAAAPGNGRIVLVGGYLTGNLTREYDPATDSWSVRAPMPTPRFGLAAVALGGKVYAIGGSGPSGAVEVYDPATDAWTPRAPLPTPRVFLAAAALDGRIYALGGSPDCCGGARTAAVEVYDPATDTWTAAAPLPAAMQLSAAAALGGRLYAFGGFVPGQGAQAGTFVYDPATGAWSPGPPMPLGRDQAPAVALGECLHVIGGSVSCHCQALDDHDCFTPDPVEADLEITKTDGVNLICPGDPVSYTIEVVNRGPAAVAGARVRDDFPGRLRGISWSCAEFAGARCGAASGGGAIDRLVDLPPGGSVVFTAGGMVAPDACGRLVNAATVEPPAGVSDPDPADNQATDSDGPGGVELRVTQDNGLEEVMAGDAVTSTIRVDNLGGCRTAARVRDDLPDEPPAELTGVSWSCDPEGGAECPGSGQGDLDHAVDLPPGGRLTYTVTGTVPAGAAGRTLTHTAVVEAACGSGQATDSDPIVDLVECEADLSIALDDPGPIAAAAGGMLEYAWRVENAGPGAVEDAVVQAAEPPVFAGDSTWTCVPAGRCDPPSGQGGVATLVDLAGDESVTVLVAGTVRPNLACSFAGAATIAPPPRCSDPDGSNNAASADLTVFPPPPGMAACKTVGGTLRPGGLLHYRIVLLNPGPFVQEDNRGSELVDALPPALAIVAATASSGDLAVVGRTLLWNGPVPVEGTVTIDLTAEVVGAFEPPLCNRGKIFFDPDGDGENDGGSTTDDPALPGAGDRTCLAPTAPLEVPTLPTAGLAALALLLAAAAVRRLRSAPARLPVPPARPRTPPPAPAGRASARRRR